MTINLIPQRLKLQKEVKNTLNQAIFGLCVILLMLGIMTLALYLYNSSVQNDLKITGDKISDQGKSLKEYQDIESSVKNANKKLTAIDSILAGKSLWGITITNISNFTPKSVQIKTMDLNRDTNNVTIQGVATTRTDIALFKEKLEKSEFQNVTFATSSYNQSTNDYTFSLSFGLEKK